VPALVAGGDAEVGFARLAGAVDHATHHGNLQRQLLVGERVLRALGDLNHVDLGATTTRAGNQVDVLALAQPERLEQLAPGAGFFDGVGGEAVANRVADALQEQRSDAGGRLQQSAGQRPRLGDAEMQRMIGDRAQFAVGLHHERHVGGLHRDLDEVEADFVEIPHLHLRALDHGVGGEPAVFFVERRIERATVHADADRHAAVARLAGDRLDVLGLADVAGVEAQTVHAGLERGERHLVLMVDVGDDRDRRTRHDLRQTLGRLFFIARAADDVATGSGERIDLLQGAFDVGGLGDGHRLHADRRVAANCDFPDVDLAGAFARERGGDGRRSHVSRAVA